MPLTLLGPLAALEAHCTVFMSEQDATKLFFPSVTFSKQVVKLTDEEAKAIRKASGESVRAKELTLWKGASGEVVMIDRVLGKHEYITYATALDPAGTVKGVEILEYRESYGHEIRRPEWRAQFTGKVATSELKLDNDIKNISGATLSCAHITGGVRRLLQTYEAIKARI